MDLAEEHRQHIDRWFHDCGHEIHRQYAQAYLANDDDMPPGLAQYCHDTIIANSSAPPTATTVPPPGKASRAAWRGRPARSRLKIPAARR
jgi:hypothetical protein